MSNNTSLTSNKEVCGLCTRKILIGQLTILCRNCDLIFHGRCATPDNFEQFRDNSYCTSCMTKNEIRRYNPFFNMFNDLNPDRFYEDEPQDFVESVEKLSNILEDCKSYSHDKLNKLVSTSKLQNNFSTFFVNIDGNKSNFDSLVTELSRIKHNFSVVALAETNINCSEKDLFCLSEEYTSVYQSKIENKKKGSGLGLYINKKFNFTLNDSLSSCDQDIESLFINITSLEKPTVVGVVYRPPNGDVERFNDEVQSLFTQLNAPSDCSCYILGDFNINLHNITYSSHQKFEELFISSGFTPLISTATHQQPNCAKTCIDNILTNNAENISLSGTLELNISNHSAIFQFTRQKPPITNNTGKITIHYEYSQANIKNFCTALDERLNDSQTVISNFNDFSAIFQSSVDDGCKLVTPKTTKRNAITNPWITAGLIKSITYKDKLYKNWKKSISNKIKNGDPVKYEAYKAYRKCLCKIIRSAKKKYYYTGYTVQLLIKNKGNSKKTWEIINKLRGKAKSDIKASFFIDNELITCRRAIATKFNNYFTSLACNLNADAYSEIPLTSFPSFYSYLNKPCEKSIFLEDCTTDELTHIIKEFKNGKASDIPIVLIKKSAAIISPCLAPLYNGCMSSGNFPDILKIGKITPIFKKGDRENIENYRPISTLPIFGKIFEKIIYSRLYKFFSSQGILDDSQFGFRQGHSTVHAIRHSVNIINDSHKAQKHVIGIFIDLSKAFDTLDHKILTEKLANCGIRGVAHSLLSSYLSERKQYTNFLGESSGLESVRYGVPQGSVLGPLLFLLYINDIVNCINDEGCKLVLYADDTNVFVIDINRDAAIHKANLLLKRINQFMKSNLLHINLGKCCFIHFEPPQVYKARTGGTCARTRPYSRNADSPKIKINDQVIKEVTSTKFLGVIIDNKLSWVPHIDMLYLKLKSATGILNRIIKFIPEENYKSLYFALFESHMNYCLTVYGSANKTHTEKLFRVQKHCVRILFGNREEYLDKFNTCARVREFSKQILGSEFYSRESSKPIFQSLNILTLPNIYNYQTCLEALKILKFHRPTSLYETYKLSQRNNSTLLILPPKTNHLTYISSRMWNTAVKALAKDCGLIDIKLGSFKRSLKNSLLEIQGKYDDIEWYPNNFSLDLINSQR